MEFSNSANSNLAVLNIAHVKNPNFLVKVAPENIEYLQENNV